MLWTLLPFVFGLVFMLKWASDGHIIITKEGLRRAVAKIADNKMRSLGTSKFVLKKMMSMLALYNTSEDVEWCNINGIVEDGLKIPVTGIANLFPEPDLTDPHRFSCRVAIGGDQITHFMQSHDVPSSPSYLRSKKQIADYTKEAWEYMNEAFAGHPNRFLKIVKTGIMEFQNLNLFDKVVGGSALWTMEHKGGEKALVPLSWAAKGIYETISEASPLNLVTSRGRQFNSGTHKLGRALHTMQDSFGPAHCMRDENNPKIIRYLYKYDHENKTPSNVVQPPPRQRWQKDALGRKNLIRQKKQKPRKTFVDTASIPGDGGWPGHVIYDDWDYNQWTRDLKDLAVEATEDWIFCVLNNIGETLATFTSAYSVIESKWLIPGLFKDADNGTKGYVLAKPPAVAAAANLLGGDALESGEESESEEAFESGE
jgi:hypothetical protein